MFNPYKYNLLEYILFGQSGYDEQELKKLLAGKTVLISGASYGIGEQLVYKLAKTKAKLLLVARSRDKLLEVKRKVESLGGNAQIYVVNLRLKEQLAAFLGNLKKDKIEVDIFVNNAGKSINRSIYDSLDRMHDFERTMSLNYYAPLEILLELIPTLIQNKGRVITVSAVNVLLIPAPKWAAYQASKAAFDHWFRSVSIELNAKGVATSSLYLPLVKTRMIEPTAAYKNMPAMKASHAADIICRAIITKRRVYSPWWLGFGQLASLCFRWPIEQYLIAKQRK